ncbi:MAG: TonB-dependent receptor [Bacteroidales bacterium]|nr:TonB-dependent receptor [Candidatus Cacconaster merdequi]
MSAKFAGLFMVVAALLLATPQQAAAQTIDVKGTVISSADGLPVIGASVLEKGTTNGTVAAADGSFKIRVKQGAVLEISAVGYATQQVEVKGETVDVILSEDSEWLDDVVVVGYGVQKKKLVTGSTVQVKGEDISKLNTTSVIGALQAQSPGVQITQNSGYLDAGFKVNIRGLGTTGDAEPLYVIDGVANGSLSALNPSDIESIDVLKDAASAAIYGARAANGVILVTTKKGKEGQSYVTYDGYYGFQNLYKIPTVLTAQEMMSIQDEQRAMDGLDPWNWPLLLGEKAYNKVKSGWQGTNWIKEMLNKNAPIQSHSVTVAGGTERNTYSLGFTYMSQDATMGVPDMIPGSRKMNFRVNNEYVALKKNDLKVLTIGETLNYRFGKSHGYFGTGDKYSNNIRDGILHSPFLPAYNDDGSFYSLQQQYEDKYDWDVANADDVNPLEKLALSNENESQSHYLQASAYVDFQPIKNLHFKSQFGYMMGASAGHSHSPIYEIGRITKHTVNTVSQSASMYNRFTWDNTASYAFDVKEHHIEVLGGASIESWGNGTSISGTKNDFIFNDLEHAYLSNCTSLTTNANDIKGSHNTDGRLASFFVRGNWNWKEKYMASVTVRADGSSNFAEGHRWGIFPSVSAGWVISNEPWMESLRGSVDFLKLRASWGQNGNCNVNAFEYLNLLKTGNLDGNGYPFGNMGANATGTYSYKITNPDLTWETSEQIDLGIDARFLRSRLAFEFDWYRKATKDWLVTAPILDHYGADAPAVNGGDVVNSGLELALRWNDNVGDFNYGVSVNGAFNKNRITRIANADGIIHGPGGGDDGILWHGCDEIYRAEVGMPIGYFFGYETAGVFQTEEEIANYKGAKLFGESTRPGDLIFVDKDKNGVIDEGDRTMIGDPHPDFTMGLSLNLEWKGIDFALTGYGAFGQQIFTCYRSVIDGASGNFSDQILQRWCGAGTSNRYPRLSFSGNNWNKVSDIYLENGDYFKIQNITLGYNIAKAFKNFPLQTLRVYVSAQNLYTFTKYSGMDPEIGYGANDSWAQGIDLGYYPSTRNILIGLSIKF